MSQYYDIDDILKEEELVPCTTLFDFSYLSHLDPDLEHNNNNDDDGDKQKQHAQHVLPENSRIKMPVWSIQTWSMRGFIRLSLPRHYNRKARERLEAAPSEVQLRKRNERYFMVGQMLIDLMERSSKEISSVINDNLSKVRRDRNAPNRRKDIAHYQHHLNQLQQVQNEALELRQTLLFAYAGERLSKTLNWSMTTVVSSNGGDFDTNVSSYTSKLTEMERHLFAICSQTTVSHYQWKMFGNQRRILIRPHKNNMYQNKNRYLGDESDRQTKRSITHSNITRNNSNNNSNRNNKKQRLLLQ